MSDNKARKWIIAVGVTVILITALGALAYWFFLAERTYHGYETIHEYDKNLPEDLKYESAFGKLICYNNEGISMYGESGELEWNAPLKMANPKIAISRGYLAVADIGGRNIMVANYSSQTVVQADMQMLNDILLTDISEQGEIAVLMEADLGYSINIYNPYDTKDKLKAEIKTYSKDDGYALSLALSNDGAKLVTEYVTSKNNEIKSSVTFYNFDKIGENSNADRIVGIFPFEDTIFPEIKFADNNTVCAYGDNRIVCFEAEREPEILWEKKIEGKIEKIASDEYGFALVTNENNKIFLSSFDYGGNSKFKEELEINAKGLWLHKGEAGVYSERGCIIFGNSGYLKFKNKFGEKLVTLRAAGDRLKYYAVLGRKLKVIKLSE